MEKEIKKKWYQSKTKIGGVIIGFSAILGTVGGWLTGTIETAFAIQSLIVEVGIVVTLFGVRDLPFINNKK